MELMARSALLAEADAYRRVIPARAFVRFHPNIAEQDKGHIHAYGVSLEKIATAYFRLFHAGSSQKRSFDTSLATASAAASNSFSPFSAVDARGSPITPCVVRDLKER
jgi:hypothetical protein